MAAHAVSLIDSYIYGFVRQERTGPGFGRARSSPEVVLFGGAALAVALLAVTVAVAFMRSRSGVSLTNAGK